MIDLSTNDQPLDGAVRSMGDRTPVGSLLSSAEWEGQPLALRQRAQFAAKVESERVLARIQQRLDETVREARRRLDSGGEGSVNTRQNFINEIRQIMADEGIRSPDGKQRSLQDPTSVARLGLIWDQQTGGAYGYTTWKNGQDPDLLAAFPAQELVRVSKRKVPRNWVARWQRAGGRVFGGRLIALKTDPIWEKISRFGTPWPPFDFNSGMGVRDVSRRECEVLGLLKKGQALKPDDLDFNARLQASVQGLTARALDDLETTFGDQVKIDGDRVKWTGGRTPPGDLLAARMPAGELRDNVLRSADVMDSTLRIPAGEEVDHLVPVGDRVSEATSNGEYYADPRATRIEMNRTTSGGAAQVTFAHESGHFLDHMILGDGETSPVATGWASETSPELADWRRAVADSDLFRVLRGERALATGPANLKFRKYVDYLMQGREAFARSFSQWVAEVSGTPEMQADIVRRVQAGGRTQYGHWSPADFQPIAAAMEAYFRQKGWLTE